MTTSSSWRQRPSHATLKSAGPVAHKTLLLVVCLLTSTGAATVEAAAVPGDAPSGAANRATSTGDEVETLIATIRTGTPKEQVAAARGIGRLVRDKVVSNDDPRVISALEELLLEGHGEASDAARSALSSLGPPALPSALKAIDSENAAARHYGAELLGDLAAGDSGNDTLLKPAADEMAKHVQDEDLTMRRAAIGALKRMGANGVPGLIRALHGPVPVSEGKTSLFDSSPQQLAAKSLAAIGEPAAGPLGEALQSTDVTTRKYATSALFLLGPKGAAAVKPLIAATNDCDEEERMGAVGALGAIGPAAREAVDRIIAVWQKDPDNPGFIYALSSIGIEYGHFDAVLEMVPGAKDATTERCFADAFASVGEPAVPRLIAMLSDEKPGMRRIAFFSLGRLGPKAEGAVGALAKALEGDEWESAAKVLGQIGPDARDAAPALVQCLARGRWDSSSRKAELRLISPGTDALALIGPDALPAILEGLKGDDDMIKAGCYVALLKGFGSDVREKLRQASQSVRAFD